MRFTFDGQQYTIVFQYDWHSGDDEVLEQHHGGHRQMTRALIFKLPHAKGDSPFAQGTVYRHFKDRNSKEAARKAALKKVLEQPPVSIPGMNQYGNLVGGQQNFTVVEYYAHVKGIVRGFRYRAWEAYLNRREVAHSANAQNPHSLNTARVERQKQNTEELKEKGA